MSKNILGIFSETDIHNINTLINELAKSSFDYLKLEGDGVKIVIGKNGVTDICTDAPAVSAAPVEAPAKVETPAVKTEEPSEKADAAAATVTQEVAAVAEETKKEETKKVAVEEKEGIFIIKSPSWGRFYAQPKPGAPPYVKVGDIVQKGDTVGLIEIMKTFTAITSEVAGEIIGIHVENEELLDPDQPLFSVKVQ